MAKAIIYSLHQRPETIVLQETQKVIEHIAKEYVGGPAATFIIMLILLLSLLLNPV